MVIQQKKNWRKNENETTNSFFFGGFMNPDIKAGKTDTLFKGISWMDIELIGLFCFLCHLVIKKSH